MNKEDFNKIFTNNETNIIEYIYTVALGEKDMVSFSKKLKLVDDEHFTTGGYGYNISFKELQVWRLNNMSSNCYTYKIFLLKDDSVTEYIDEINKLILRHLNKEVKNLKKSIELIS